MVVVAPDDSTNATCHAKFTRFDVPTRRLLVFVYSLYSVWEHIQVSRHGAYTSRRTRALERYVHSASIVRVLVVCALTPVPVLAFVVLQELVPLDIPGAGCKANYRWFIRSAVIFMVLTLSYIQQGVIFLAPLKVSWKQALVITSSTTAVYFAVLVAISSAWVFPIPFASVLTTGVFTCLFFGFFVGVVGWRTLTTTPRLSAHVQILKGVLVVETLLVVVYPAFNAAFRLLRGAQQLAFLLVLFLLKMATRFVMAYALRRGKGGASVEERWRARLPEVVVFSTELFHVLYLTACLQGQDVSVWATIGLSLFDASGSCISVRRLLQRPSMTLISKSSGSSSSKLSTIVPMAGPTLATIDSTASLHKLIRRHTAGVMPSARRISFGFSSSASNLKLARRSSARSSGRSHQSASRSISRSAYAGRWKKPLRMPSSLSTESIAAEVSRLETLSMIEYFLLVEYVKLIIPGMYAVFQVVLTRLPNAVYYPSIATATPPELRRAHINMLVFVAMEVVLLTLFILLLHRRLKFSVLHQLAFVLETAADDIQAKLAMFIPYCFFFFLEHNGVDYTFQFAWQHHPR